MANTLNVSLSLHVLSEVSKISKRSVSEAMRKMVMDTDVNLDLLRAIKETKHTSCTLDDASDKKIKEVAQALGVTEGAALRLMSEAHAMRRTQPELFAAIDGLKRRHRHSNSPIPEDLGPERETKTAA